MLTMAIHTGEPSEFIAEIDKSIKDEPPSDMVGDLGNLERLKAARAQCRR